ncbi:MAG: hypothetical protein JXR94_16765 [Candidatus Hydrogenedentes bacterium]|nr:hypothetical protein [Candidatus Hydrogenedentota bacterium]
MRSFSIRCSGMAAVLGLLLAAGAGAGAGLEVRGWVGWVDRDAIEVERMEDGLVARFRVQNPLGGAESGRLDVSIVDLDGNTLLEQSTPVSLMSRWNRFSLHLAGSLPEERIPLCVLRYAFRGPHGTERGARSLAAVMAQLECRVVAYRSLLAGSRASVRFVAANHATGEPVRGARVEAVLAGESGETRLFSGETNGEGTLELRFDVPEEIEGDAEVRIVVTSKRLGEDRIVLPVSIRRAAKILLTTDKPMYQPGQRIQMRALCLSAADLTPEAGQALVFEVMDSRGNKVFKRAVDTDEFGIAAGEFDLASEVNLGAYMVRAVLGSVETEKQVTVDRYVLPKFKVNVKTGKDYYLPGETLTGEVQADYFFGKPVSEGRVHIVASKFEIGFEEFAELDGTLDGNGHWTFELPLPAYFAGTPIEQGAASVRLEAVVTDTADHREEKVVMTPVAEAPLTIYAVPEGGALAPGLGNRVFLLVSHPDGSPAAKAALTIQGPRVDAAETDRRTDALGIATVTVRPDRAGTVALKVTARDRQGRSVEKEFSLSCEGGADSLILRTDKTLYRVGDTLQAEVFATKASGTVYFDMVRAGQTVMTRAAELAAGRATLELDLDAALAGGIGIQAYTFTPGTDIVRDSRHVYVNPADALELGVELDREVYKPGETARLRFRVTNRAGAPTAAAIGLAIVDESVFALQEIHPGLEKVYFTLEKEIMQPRYEIHGYDIDSLITRGPVREEGGPRTEPAWSADQQTAACVLLASAPELPEPPVKINTFTERQAGAAQAAQERVQRDLEHIQRAVQKYLRWHSDVAADTLLKGLLRDKYLRENELLDPWGNAYSLDLSRAVKSGGYFSITSAGPDEIHGTPDDIVAVPPRRVAKGGLMRHWAAQDAEPEMIAFGVGAGVAEDKLMVLDEAAPVPSASAAAGSADQPVRLRHYFPETLLFEPALIADGSGVAVLDVPLADSITTWRMTAMASSRAGALGSKDAPLRVFQDFFVDIDLPVALTQHDRVSIPVVVYNYLKEAQEIRLKFEEEPWFAFEGDSELVMTLGPEQVRSVYFPIEVVELGAHRLTVYAYGAQMSDAIRRQIEVLPDGQEQNVTFSDRLSGRIEHSIEIPAHAVDGASKILVRIFPGVYSQIVDGMDSMLRMPCGCFEQTTAATYPNVLIVQYMKATDQINPETQMKAEGFINAGYQRLLAYEVNGGGFSWFGDAPANKALTALGLKQFYDMAEVHEVDPAVIERTRAWLLAQQESDGSWRPDEQYLHAESWTHIQNSGVLVTAYIAEAVISTGERGGGARKAIDYLRANWGDSREPYVVALVANALASWDPKDPLTQRVLDTLYDLRKEDKETAHWEGASGTVTFTHGAAADIETTALAAIALLKANKYPETATKALTYLIRAKSSQGHWGSTQPTILALKALMLSLGSRTETVDATVSVDLNGERAAEVRVTPEDSDVMRLIDLGDRTRAAANTVVLDLEGEGSLLYQIVGRYYEPWAGAAPAQEPPMTIAVEYDKRELAVNDLVAASVSVHNTRPAAAQMIIVDLGIPPGFQVVAADLEALVQDGTLDKYELTARQIICYFEKIDANGTIEFSYKLQAKFPLRAQTPQSRVYEYYNPEVSHTAAPEEIVVE